MLSAGVLGERDIASSLGSCWEQFWSHHRAQPRPWGASIFPFVPCPRPVCHVAARAASPPALPRSPLSVCSFMGGVPLPIPPSWKEVQSLLFLLRVRPSPPKPGWQGRRKGCEVVSSARDPGLNRLMVRRMLGSVCTCIPSRRACPLEHPENARGSAWLRWSTTWPGGAEEKTLLVHKQPGRGGGWACGM